MTEEQKEKRVGRVCWKDSVSRLGRKRHRR